MAEEELTVVHCGALCGYVIRDRPVRIAEEIVGLHMVAEHFDYVRDFWADVREVT